MCLCLCVVNSSQRVELEDICFHQCVDLSRYQKDRIVSFIPPDGEFELLRYRLDYIALPLFWIEMSVELHSRTRMEYFITTRSRSKRLFTANNVEIHIPAPCDVANIEIETSVGKAEHIQEKDIIAWRIPTFTEHLEYSLGVSFRFPSISAESVDRATISKAPIAVMFQIPNFTASGIHIKYLNTSEESGYDVKRWVRYSTENGDYRIRMKEIGR